MWKCEKCSERVEDSFEVCWNCGTSKEGVEDPLFRTADEIEVVVESRADGEQGEKVSREVVDIDGELAGQFVCSRCKNREASVKRIATTGAGLSRLLDIQNNVFVAVSCARCGLTELYDARILATNGVEMSDRG